MVEDHFTLPIIKRKNQNNWASIIKNQAVDFCLATGLHGYKYIVQSNRSKTERFIWSVIVISSLCCSLVLVNTAWEYSKEHSTLTVIETTHHGVWNLPFPAVTICNNNQVSLKKSQEFVENLTVIKNLSRKYILQEMRLLVELLDPGVFDHDVQSNLTALQDIFEANNHTIDNVVKSVKQDCFGLLKACKWKGNHTPCYEIFEESYSRDGLCCSFNYFHSRNKIHAKKKPKRLTATGYQTGLVVLVDPQPDDYFSSLYGSFGVKVMLHDPYDYPDRSSEFKLVGHGVQAFLAISPEETYSTPSVKDLPMKIRDCIFLHEQLPDALVSMNKNYTWIRYSYNNCLNECRGHTVLKKCNCVPYYIPQNGSRICNLRDVKCLQGIRSEYDTSWPGTRIKSSELPNLKIDIFDRPCGCLLDCTELRYPFDSTHGFLEGEKFYNELYKNSIMRFFKPNTTQTAQSRNYSLLNFFYTDLVSTQYRRDGFYNWKNLFASFGGLLGLFVGFSIMSAFELVYFFIVRVIADIFKRKTERRGLERVSL